MELNRDREVHMIMLIVAHPCVLRHEQRAKWHEVRSAPQQWFVEGRRENDALDPDAVSLAGFGERQEMLSQGSPVDKQSIHSPLLIKLESSYPSLSKIEIGS